MLFWGKFQIITSVLFLRVGFLSPLFFTLFPTMVRWGIFDFCVKINPKSFETAIGLFWAEWSLPSCANQFFGHLLCLHGSIAFQEPWRPRRGEFCCSKEYQYEVGCGKPGHDTQYESLYVGFIILLGIYAYWQEERVGRTLTNVVVVLYCSFVLRTLLGVKTYYLLLLRIEHLYSFHDHLVFPVGGVASFFEAAICSYHLIFITLGMVDFGDTMLNKNVI